MWSVIRWGREKAAFARRAVTAIFFVLTFPVHKGELPSLPQSFAQHKSGVKTRGSQTHFLYASLPRWQLKRNSPDGDDGASVQREAIDLCNEDWGHSLVQGSAVHIDGSSDGQDKPGHPRIHFVIFFQASESDGQRCSAGSRTQGGNPGLEEPFEVGKRVSPCDEEE